MKKTVFKKAMSLILVMVMALSVCGLSATATTAEFPMGFSEGDFGDYVSEYWATQGGWKVVNYDDRVSMHCTTSGWSSVQIYPNVTDGKIGDFEFTFDVNVKEITAWGPMAAVTFRDNWRFEICQGGLRLTANGSVVQWSWIPFGSEWYNRWHTVKITATGTAVTVTVDDEASCTNAWQETPAEIADEGIMSFVSYGCDVYFANAVLKADDGIVPEVYDATVIPSAAESLKKTWADNKDDASSLDWSNYAWKAEYTNSNLGVWADMALAAGASDNFSFNGTVQAQPAVYVFADAVELLANQYADGEWWSKSAVTYTCQSDGDYAVYCPMITPGYEGAFSADGADGHVTLYKNGEKIWPVNEAYASVTSENEPKFETLKLTLKAGDQLRFEGFGGAVGQDIAYNNPNGWINHIMINPSVARYKAGDMNADETVGAEDMAILCNTILGVSAQSVLSDVNGDKEVNILDLVRMKKIIASGVTVND